MTDSSGDADSRTPAQSLGVVAAVVVLAALLAFAGSSGGEALGPVPLFALAVAAAVIAQWLVWIPSALARSDRWFDATGALTYIGVTVALALLTPNADARTWLLAALVTVWAARLGTFLFARNVRSGTDSRFDEIKVRPLRFLSVWSVQGLWVSLTAAAAWIGITSMERAPLGALAYLGIVLWLAGFVIEVVADSQKARFRADPANAGLFIASGLWSRSRHPNYFGEIVLWIGVFVIAAEVLTGWQWVALLSPAFVILLLTRVSGIPLLERRADARWGDDPAYAQHKAATPVLIPKLLPPKH